MNSVKVSIIVPVYNAANFIERTVKSILAQSLREIEVIIINDGSTDDSERIINEWGAKDIRIVALHTSNGGVGAARNKGIELARGEFIGFVDADDWIEVEMYNTLYLESLKANADLAICNINVINHNKVQEYPRLNLIDSVVDTSETKAAELVKYLRFKYDYSNWNKIYSKEIVTKGGILFSETMTIWEDLLFNLSYLQFSKKAVIVNTCLYNYFIHPLSVMNSHKHDTIQEFNMLYEEFTHFCSKNKFPEIQALFKREMSRNFYYAIIPQVFQRVSKKSGSLNRIGEFVNELKKLDTDLLSFNRCELAGWQGFKKQLLLGRFYSLFSLITSVGSLKTNIGYFKN